MFLRTLRAAGTAVFLRVAIEQRKKREPQGWDACISDHVALSSYVAKATIDTEREGRSGDERCGRGWWCQYKTKITIKSQKISTKYLNFKC